MFGGAEFFLMMQTPAAQNTENGRQIEWTISFEHCTSQNWSGHLYCKISALSVHMYCKAFISVLR